MKDDDPTKISLLIDIILQYSNEKKFKLIRGPINIPTLIYGWGFMKEGSKDTLYIGKPVNPPIYQECFIKEKFYLKYEELTWEGPMPRVNPWRMKEYDFTEYDYFNPKNWEELMEFKDEFLGLHAKTLPPSSRLTPNIGGLFGNYAKFVFKFGYNFMFSLVRYKPTGKIVACGSCVPNPFSKDEKGNYNTIVYYTWVVDPDFRRKGLSMLVYGGTSLQAWKKKIRYSAGPLGKDNKASFKAANKLGGYIGRTHLVLEREII